MRLLGKALGVHQGFNFKWVKWQLTLDLLVSLCPVLER
jgi:hypothetical protein